MSSPRIQWISRADPPQAFPDIEHALEEPNGLLAAGGDLSVARLLHAYQHGIFPWYEEGQPVLWWSPEPRCVIEPERFHLSRRSRRALRGSGFTVSLNRAFLDVVKACAAPRAGQDGTWITADMMSAFESLHRKGWAHSIEISSNGRLVGGVYGVAISRVFFGESMFSAESNASKAALYVLCGLLAKRGCPLLDCQVESPHLASLGATLMPRALFKQVLVDACHPLRPMLLEAPEYTDLPSLL